MKKLIYKGIKFWESELSLRIFFISIIILNFVLIPISTSHQSGPLIARIFYIILIVSGTYALIKSRLFTFIAISFSIIAFIVWLLSIANDFLWLNIVDGLIQTFLYIIFLTLILVKVFRDGIFSFRKLEGAITGYLLIGNMFATFYYTLSLILGHDTFHIPGGMHIASFTYFSYTTLTTMGYGDITPLHPFARSLSNLEAIIGQLYPAILIARLLSWETLKGISKKSNLKE